MAAAATRRPARARSTTTRPSSCSRSSSTTSTPRRRPKPPREHRLRRCSSGHTARVRFREATPDDAPQMRARMLEGFDTYYEFAPPGWEAGRASEEAFRERLALKSHWCVIAVGDGGAELGHSAFLDSADSGHPDPEPGLAHFWQLFV